MRGVNEARDFAGWAYRLKRWMYREGHPNLLARLMDRISSLQFSIGIFAPRRWVALEVHGRREAVRLDEVEVGARAPILRRYLADAPVSDPGSLYCTGSR